MATSGAASKDGDVDISVLFDVPGVHSADRREQPIHRPQVENARLLVRHARLVERLNVWLAEDGYDQKKGGRPSDYSAEQVLTLVVLLALEGQDLHVTRMRDAVLHRFTENAAKYLDIEQGSNKWVQRRTATYHRLWRSVRRVLKPLDPHPDEQRRRRYTKEEWATLLRERDTDLATRRLARLAEFNNALVWSTFEALPERLRARWGGTVCVDGTHIPSVKKGTSKRSTRVSSEANAGWYIRSHEVLQDGSITGKDAVKWAWDAALAVMAEPGSGGDYPRLVLGMSLDKPGVAPTGNAMIALRNVLNADLPREYMVGDRIYYPMAKPEQWQIPIRKAGYRIVGDLLVQSDRTEQKSGVGVQGHFGGANLVDGSWFCPAMPKPLTNASLDSHEGRISEEDWRQRLERRQRYLLRPKEGPRDNGSQCFKCPASGPGATVACPLKPASERNETGRLTKIMPADLPEHPGPICTNANSLTIPLAAGAKYAQSLVWESEDWHKAYDYPRNTVESKNDALKRTAGGSIAVHDRRLLRGVAGQFFLIGVMIAVENLRAIETYLRAERDNDRPAPPPPKRPGSPAPSKRSSRLGDLLQPSLAPPLAA